MENLITADRKAMKGKLRQPGIIRFRKTDRTTKAGTRIASKNNL